MKKEFVIFVLAVLLISSFGNVYAAGRGGGGDGGDTTNTEGMMRDPAAARVNCDDAITLTTMRARIHCRIQNRATYVAPVDSVPEACRDLRTTEENSEDPQGRCVSYYRLITPCYDADSPQSKRACLMRVAGISTRLADESEDRAEKARNYIVAVLYNLEERLEEMNEAGTITDDVAADGIAKIVEIKRMILEGKTRTEIMPKMQEFKRWWHENISPLRDTGNDSDDGDEDTTQ